MVKGKGWRVPPTHAGSQGDNFITKAALTRPNGMTFKRYHL